MSSTEIIAQMIEQEANLMEFHLVASLNKGRGQICSVTLEENSALHGKSVREVVFPKGALLISIVRNNKLIIPGGDTVRKRAMRLLRYARNAHRRHLSA